MCALARSPWRAPITKAAPRLHQAACSVWKRLAFVAMCGPDVDRVAKCGVDISASAAGLAGTRRLSDVRPREKGAVNRRARSPKRACAPPGRFASCRVPSRVLVDPGAKRIWFSRMIQFVGSRARARARRAVFRVVVRFIHDRARVPPTGSQQ